MVQETWVHVYAIEDHFGWKMVSAKCTVKEIFWGYRRYVLVWVWMLHYTFLRVG